MRAIPAASVLVAAICCLVFQGCGSRGLLSGPQSVPNAEPGASLLPGIAELTQHRASFTEADLVRDGADYEVGLANFRVSPVGSLLGFNPAGDLNSGSDNLALAVYRFGVDGYNRDLTLRLTWTTAPQVGSAYLAIANFSSGKWRWFPITATNVVSFSDLAAYTSPAPGNSLYAAVLVGGSAPASLQNIRLGLVPTPGNPTASLAADPVMGLAPLFVDFDGSGSAADSPAVITKYEFDFGEGGGFVDFGSNSQAQHEYNTDGTYSARLRVTDSFGGQDTASVTIEVGVVVSYDEVEPNGSIAQANQLPAIPFSSFTGSIGSGPGHPGYDGSTEDVYSFSTIGMSNFTFTLSHGGSTGSVLLLLQHPVSGNLLSSAGSVSGQAELSYTLTGSEPPSLVLSVVALNGAYGNYQLAAEADLPVAVLDVSSTNGISPHLVNFDGGNSTAVAPRTIVSYEFDPEGDGTYQAPQVSALSSHTYTEGGTYHAKLRVTDSSGFKDTATRTIVVDSLYQEVEDNDIESEFNQLALPQSNFLASIGSGAGYDSYDGDSLDGYRFSAQAGDYVSAVLHQQSGTGGLELSWYDSGLTFFDSRATRHGRAELRALLTTDLEFLVTVSPASLGDYGDYLLDIQLNPPDAQLSADVVQGDLPLLVTLNASASTDNDFIVSYRFDPEGTGNFSAPQASPFYQHSYSAEGFVTAAVLVKDNNGNESLAEVILMPGKNYHEVENNDSDAEASELLLPVIDYSASLGANGSYLGYDGDSDDYFHYSAPIGQRIKFTITYDDSIGDLDASFYDSVMGWQQSVNGSGGSLTLEQLVDPLDQQPFILHITTPNGYYGDYSIEALTDMPTAVLVASPHIGSSPLNVTLDASASYVAPPGLILSYEFDPEGDGTFLPPQVGATLNHVYSDPGAFYPQVRILDDMGGTDVGSTGVYVDMSYDEVEPNNSLGSAQVLMLPITGFTASNRSGPGYPGYSGDNADFFQLSNQDSGTVILNLAYDDSTGNLSIQLFDSSATSLKIGNGSGGSLRLVYGITGSENLPLIARVWSPAADHYGDYSLSSESYSEIEPNDSSAQAQFLSLPVPLFLGSNGSGPGYTGLDGDNIDFFSFQFHENAPILTGQTISFGLLHSDAEGDLTLELLDADDVSLATEVSSGGFAALDYVVQGTETMPYYFRIWDQNGTHFGDYFFGISVSP